MNYVISFFLFLIPIYAVSVEFKVASYNVQNLFDEIKDGSEYNEYIPSKHNWSIRMVDIKLNNISEVLCELDADIVALQEIENESILKRLQKRLKRVGCPYRYRAITKQKKNIAINVALLSRYPIVRSREILVNYSPKDRNILEVTLDIDGYPLMIFVNHWKAKSRGGKESRRINYAKALVKRLANLPKTTEYIILGDINSHYDEYRVLSDKLNDTKGKTAINHILQTIKDDQMLSEDDILLPSSTGHYNLWLEYPHAARWSHNFYGRKGAIDHIILPHRLFDKSGIEYLNNSFGVFKDPILFTRKGWINSWQYKNSKHLGRGYSDHLPIYATFSTDPYKKDIKHLPEISKIENLYNIETLIHPVILKDCTLILKRGDNGVIKQSQNGMAIYLYGTARGLVEGRRYDIIVDQIDSYNGLKEITQLKYTDKGTDAKIDDYYLDQSRLDYKNPKIQNQIFTNLSGIYRDDHIEIDHKKIAIYFKRKRDRPPNNTKIDIHFAHLGYYHKPQLVIYSHRDFSIQR